MSHQKCCLALCLLLFSEPQILYNQILGKTERFKKKHLIQHSYLKHTSFSFSQSPYVFDLCHDDDDDDSSHLNNNYNLLNMNCAFRSTAMCLLPSTHSLWWFLLQFISQNYFSPFKHCYKICPVYKNIVNKIIIYLTPSL